MRVDRPVRERRHRLPKEAYLGQVDAAFTMCVAGRHPLFTDHQITGTFIDILRDSVRRYDSTTLLYCFMPDHVHVVLRGVTSDADIMRAIVAFKQATGFWLGKHAQGLRWQKSFFDRVVRRGEDLTASLRYIAENPIRAGLVTNWREYPHLGSDVAALEDMLVAG